MKRFFGTIVLLLLILFFNGFSKENKLEKNVRTFVNIMDYISTDYHNSVEKGKVISQCEFTEMNDFIEKAINIFPAISNEDRTINTELILKKLNELQNLIRNKKDKKLVSEKSNAIKQIVLSYNLIKISPLQWPSITKGKKVFQANCVSCHGSDGSGDGPLAPKLDPKPANLLNNDLMNSISPFQIYNTIRLVVSGTSMPSFDQINDYDAWNTAFYVSSLRY